MAAEAPNQSKSRWQQQAMFVRLAQATLRHWLKLDHPCLRAPNGATRRE